MSETTSTSVVPPNRIARIPAEIVAKVRYLAAQPELKYTDVTDFVLRAVEHEIDQAENRLPRLRRAREAGR